MKQSKRRFLGWSLLMLTGLLVASWFVFKPFQRLQDGYASQQVASVSGDDVEMAWLHTSTNGTTWERFVTGLMKLDVEGGTLTVNDAGAFPKSTTTPAEVVISSKNSPGGKLLIRWYKLSGAMNEKSWIDALCKRARPPVAMIGGGTSDRAKALAVALQEKHNKGFTTPLLFITTATEDSLTSIYPERTFRFCFSNTQMAQAVISLAKQQQKATPYSVSVKWQDDPYSQDLGQIFDSYLKPSSTHLVDYSIGGNLHPNPGEAVVVDKLVQDFRAHPEQPLQLILPTVTLPARRLLRALLEREPTLRGRLSVLTGDGISVNALLRDAEVSWSFSAMPVPVYLFTHADPFDRAAGWDAEDKSSTDDVSHFKKLGDIITQAVFQPKYGVPFNHSDLLAGHLLRLEPPQFKTNGDRLGTGEFVVVLSPDEQFKPRLQAYSRGANGLWSLVSQPGER